MHFNYKGNAFQPAVSIERVANPGSWRRKRHFGGFRMREHQGGHHPAPQPHDEAIERDTRTNSGTSLGNKNKNCIRLSLPHSLTHTHTHTQNTVCLAQPLWVENGAEGWSGRQMAFHGRCRHSLTVAVALVVASELLSATATTSYTERN